MLSKAKIKLIQSLDQKKKRLEEHLFVAEGPKVVGDLLPYFTCSLIVGKSSWLTANPAIRASEIIEATSEELRKASFLKAPQEVLALFQLPTYSVHQDITSKELCLALDDIQDPGNLGTIIRSAVAFNIDSIILSKETVDLYNPKVLRATQGMIFNMNIITRDLVPFISLLKDDNYKIYSTNVVNGKEIKTLEKVSKYAIIMGSEGQGVKKEIGDMSDENIYIKMNPLCESLNVGVAASIILYELYK